MKCRISLSSSVRRTVFLRYIFGVLSLVLLIGCTPNKQRSIVILYDNDVHCNIDGYALMKGLGDEISDTAWVGLTSSGDFLHGGTAGAISGGRYILDIMKSVGYDAVGLGNHEFDFGVPHLLEVMEECGLPVVCANLRPLNSNKPFYAPYIVRKYGQRSIAFIGIVTPESLISESYAFYDKQGNRLYSLTEDSLVELVQETVDEVRASGVDYVVLLSHLGERSIKNYMNSHELIKKTHGIDVVLDGHSHSQVPCDTIMSKSGRHVIISQTGSLFKNVGKLLIDAEGNVSTELIPLDSIRVENAHVRHITDSIHEAMSLITSRKVCHSDYTMSIYDENGRQKVRYAETSVGNLVCDAFRAVSGAQIAVNNGGGIRTTLPNGDWTYGDIISLLPYNNNLQTVKVKGSKLIELLVASTSNTPKEDGQFPQISGFRFTLDTLAQGSARISRVEILNDKTGRYSVLDPKAEYTLCTTDYCISGGGMYNVLRDAEILCDKIVLYSDALAEYVEKQLNGEIPERYSTTQGRIRFK